MFFDVASSSFQNCKYLFSIFLINSGIVLALMGSVVSALSQAQHTLVMCNVMECAQMLVSFGLSSHLGSQVWGTSSESP